MDKELFDYVAQRVDVLATTDTSKQETKEAALAWKAAVEADANAADAATETLLNYLEGRMSPIENFIAFVQGSGAEVFGEEQAAGMLAAAQERQAQGWQFCICDAHVAAGELLIKLGRVA